MKKIIDKLAWVYIRDGKLLTVRSKGKALFYLPGGKREQGESDEQALVREINEEISVDLVSDTIKYVDTFTAQADGKDDGVLVQLTCYTAEYSGKLSPDAEIEELKFVDANDEAICSLATKVAMDWLVSRSLISE
ncbi:NUDIX hydrolase [Photobacterium sanguinicancri]|uniref:NUDIX domain-containing protein n=1 Tax=Photobacterium sanguinicancri TaxID=875932 RepID=A0AAW7Y778_9GAMM|nr:NUDIX domain-containing protein [Photobacterium sanguinicancri]KXI23571.1 NUDIX hydrolase [Photobacterium sanguinicancri]MDO6543890.1 NUDIX domain-containing protein [Photobacterium sanguinicancri]